jgi:hypothetical protein
MKLLTLFFKSADLMRTWSAVPWVRFAGLTLYYLGILWGLIAMYGRGDFSTPPFIYQNF